MLTFNIRQVSRSIIRKISSHAKRDNKIMLKTRDQFNKMKLVDLKTMECMLVSKKMKRKKKKNYPCE